MCWVGDRKVVLKSRASAPWKMRSKGSGEVEKGGGRMCFCEWSGDSAVEMMEAMVSNLLKTNGTHDIQDPLDSVGDHMIARSLGPSEVKPNVQQNEFGNSGNKAIKFNLVITMGLTP